MVVSMKHRANKLIIHNEYECILQTMHAMKYLKENYILNGTLMFKSRAKSWLMLWVF